MLRALTSYFFGGIQDETPEAPIECETREVNDWLVVNLPDQNKDNINLNEDDDTYEIDDGDIRNEIDDEEDDGVELDASDVDEMDEEENEDEILMSLSFLMMPPVECDSLYTEVILEPYPMSQFYDLLAHPNWDNRQLMDIERSSEQIMDLVFPVQPPMPRPCERYRQQNEALYEFFNGRKVEKRGQRNAIVSEYDRVNAQAIELAPPPTYSKSYVNHRHPEKLLSHRSDNEEQSERTKKQRYEDYLKSLADIDSMRKFYSQIRRRLEEAFFEEGSRESKVFAAKTRSNRAERDRRFREEEEYRNRRFHEDEDYRKRLISDAIAKCPRKEARLSQIGEREREWMFGDASARRNDFIYKTNILQRIKELEPEQEAAQRSAKKILTRGQLNRQNKNYMYETSSKKNRRSKLQRNHSGANNNRKC